jgi:hypothetical protein
MKRRAPIDARLSCCVSVLLAPPTARALGDCSGASVRLLFLFVQSLAFFAEMLTPRTRAAVFLFDIISRVAFGIVVIDISFDRVPWGILCHASHLLPFARVANYGPNSCRALLTAG